MVLDSAAATVSLARNILFSNHLPDDFFLQNVVSAAMNGRGKASEFSASEKEPMTDTDRERTDGERATANKSSIVKLYIMKMARPRGGEENGTLKKLHGEFTAIQAEIKGIQTRLNDKRVSSDHGSDRAARFSILAAQTLAINSLCRRL